MTAFEWRGRKGLGRELIFDWQLLLLYPCLILEGDIVLELDTFGPFLTTFLSFTAAPAEADEAERNAEKC